MAAKKGGAKAPAKKATGRSQRAVEETKLPDGGEASGLPAITTAAGETVQGDERLDFAPAGGVFLQDGVLVNADGEELEETDDEDEGDEE
jgi:hypothetical protein